MAMSMSMAVGMATYMPITLAMVHGNGLAHDIRSPPPQKINIYIYMGKFFWGVPL